ncbi:MAG: hypothetical protein EBV92_02955 [Betaproteobacteria bacterium]|nr:hypothetical protein [Betaproteobacteria bacterium]
MIPDTSLAKRAILRRIRSAQGHGDPSKASPADRARVEQRDAYLAARPRGKGPSVGADLLDHFCEQAQRMASSVERVSGYADVPQAVLRYLITHQLSLRVAAWPLLSTIDFSIASAARSRNARRGFRCGFVITTVASRNKQRSWAQAGLA